MKYIMIINKDRKGLMAEISEILGQNKININSIEAHSENGLAQFRLETSDNDRSLGQHRGLSIGTVSSCLGGFETVPVYLSPHAQFSVGDQLI